MEAAQLLTLTRVELTKEPITSVQSTIVTEKCGIYEEHRAVDYIQKTNKISLLTKSSVS